MSTAVEQREYSEAERRQGMAVYAFVSGSEKRGVALLEEADLDIPWGTIRSWVQRHRDEYRQAKAEVDEHARSLMADTHRRIANLAMESEEEALRQLGDLLREGKIDKRELPKVLQSLGITSGIHTEKGELLSGHATQRVGADIGDIAAALEAAGVEVITGEAEDDDEPPALPPAAP
ncbi:MAG TPA: hypothetical protein VF245_12910 [Solirubrobacterales bacterium]